MLANGLRVAVIDVVTDEFAKRWREDLDGLPIELALLKDPGEQALSEAVAGAHVIIARRRAIDAGVLDAAGNSPRCVIKLSRWSIGMDLDACERRSVDVKNVPQLGCITVAEHAMTFLLMCARDMIGSHLGVVNGRYRDYDLTPEVTTERSFAFKWIPVTPVEPYGQTLGIIGFGEIGKELATRAGAFGMKILYHDQLRPPAAIESDLRAEYRDLDSLLEESDFVSLHIPHTPATEGLVGAREFKRMKSTAYILNACRGGVIDEPAMVAALKSGDIAGAGLDVFVEEPLPYDHPLTTLDNVVLSPHTGGGAGTGRADQRAQLHALISDLL